MGNYAVCMMNNCRNRRAYRIGQTYPHDGGECPLADGSVRVSISGWPLKTPAKDIDWSSVTSFTPIDEGKSA